MKVYVVTSKDIGADDTYQHGVFSTRKLAQAKVDSLVVNDEYDPDDIDIFKVTLDDTNVLDSRF